MSKDIQIEHEQRLTRVEEAVITMVKTVDRMDRRMDKLDQKVDKAVEEMRTDTKSLQSTINRMGAGILGSVMVAVITFMLKH